ncbi:MAG: DUF4147 domain-containing protein [Myxococcales bacterium]|nr:DUF4147 domain-containing protein [Myxococcales bacterium]
MNRDPAIRDVLEAVFRAALAAIEPAAAVRRHVARDADGAIRVAGEPLAAGARVWLLAAGKAAAPMAQAVEACLAERLTGGLVVVPDGHGLALSRVQTCEAAHPVPDARCEGAARRAQALVDSVAPGDVLIVLLSGGASSLLSCPVPGLALEDLAATTAALLEGGAAIDALNAVRKHLSDSAGGRLALRARGARVEVLVISDVPDDRIDVIASGPFAGDLSSYRDALDVVAACGARKRLPARALAHLEAGARGEREETPDPGDARLRRVRHTLIACNATALDAARRASAGLGLRPVRVTEQLRGEARAAGTHLGALCGALRADTPVCLLAGGETVVHVRGSGRGGRNQELALAAALALEGQGGCALLAAGTDGRDGPTDAAGAFADGGSVARGRARGRDARAALDDNDAYGFFSAEGGLFRTGPTRTNVMDLALAYVDPAAKSR